MLSVNHILKRGAATTVACAVLVAWASTARILAQEATDDPAASARAKLGALEHGALADPAALLSFSETEANAWISSELAQRSAAGVDSVRMEFLADRLAGTALLDFDVLRRSSRRPLPPLSEYVLTGKHEVRVEGTLSGRGGKGQFRLERVEVDGLPIPPLLFDLLLNTLLRGRFPGLDLDAPFDLPYSIDTLRVQPGRITVAGARAALP